MKTRIASPILLAVAGVVLSAGPIGLAVAQTASATAATPHAVEAAAPAQWGDSVSEVLKLSHAGVGQDTIVAYVVNSGRTYNLSATEIIGLKQQGISDGVLTAMLQQSHKPAMGAVEPQSAPQAPPPAATSPGAYEASSPQYVTTASAPASTTYVVPSSAPVYSYPYYSYYPYSYPYYPYYGYPAVSFAFGFGGGYGGHYGYSCGYHGGYYGGYHGGYHSGGGHGGHH